jgi:hypothetical protein
MSYSKIKELQNVIDRMGEHLLSTSDEDILQESREEGDDPHSDATNLRNSMLQTVKTFRRRTLRSAQLAVSRAPHAPSLPTSVYAAKPHERRTLLLSKLQQSEVTAQFRNLDQMTDEDVISALEDLAALEALREKE